MRFLTGCQKKNGESIKLEEEFFAEYDVFFLPIHQEGPEQV